MKIKNLISKFLLYQNTEDAYNFDLYDVPQSTIAETEKNISNNNRQVSNILSENIEYLKTKYNLLINSDIKLREFKVLADNKKYNAFIFYIDGMINSDSINDFVLFPLMLRNKSNTYKPEIESKNSEIISSILVTKNTDNHFNLENYIYESLIPQNTIKKVKDFENIISGVNSGSCILFIDTLNIAFDIDVKGFKARSVSEPNNEIVVRGPQEAFVEVIRTNTSLLRRIINNENFIIEKSSVGKISKTSVAICYMKNIANDSLVSEVKFRINNINIDYLISSGQLEQLIQDNGNVSVPQMVATERPDRVANAILNGRVAILLNGSPYALITPGILIDYLSSPEDINSKHQFGNLLKLVRLIALFLSLLLPGIYIAVSNYHHEFIPTELVFAIVASRESVPFPIIFEIILMELSFELIREAGVRTPSVLGTTIGIVGALILGEAAVSANVVSPILIIIVAITGICSFAVPDYSLSSSIRIYRFLYILLAFFAGLLGIAIRSFYTIYYFFKFKIFWGKLFGFIS